MTVGGVGQRLLMVIIHDHSQYLLSFSIIIDRRIFWFSYSNLSQDYRTIYTTYPICLTKSSNKIVAIFLYHVSVFAIKQEKHLTGGGGGCSFNELFFERAGNDRMQSERQDTILAVSIRLRKIRVIELNSWASQHASTGR